MEITTKEIIVTEGLVLHLDAVSGFGTDLSGNGNIPSMSNNVYDGQSYQLTSNSSNTLSGTNLNLTGAEFTIESWIYYVGNSFEGNHGQIFTQDDGFADGQGWQWRIPNLGDIPEFIYWTSSSRSSAVGFSYNTAIVSGNWHHIVVSYDGTDIKGYINGSLDVTHTPASSLYGSTASIGIGMFSGTRNTLNGKISIIRAYKNYYLSEDQIYKNYINQKGRFFGQNNLTIEVKPPVSEAVLYLDAAIETSYPGYGTRWFDLSGYRNNGTLLNGVAYDSGDGGYLSFDGIDDYITVPYSDIFNMTNLTVMSWFYISSFPDFQQYRIIDHQETPERAWGLQMGRGDYVGGGYTSSDIILFCHSNDGISQKNLPCSTKLSLNTWYHGGFSNDGTTLKIYLNGSLTDTTSSLGNQYSSTNNDIVIGCSGETRNEFFWNGRISHCSVYNRALTELEIEKDYIYQRDRFLGLSNFGQSSLIIS
jgi:hypothetical protein